MPAQGGSDGELAELSKMKDESTRSVAENGSFPTRNSANCVSISAPEPASAPAAQRHRATTEISAGRRTHFTSLMRKEDIDDFEFQVESRLTSHGDYVTDFTDEGETCRPHMTQVRPTRRPSFPTGKSAASSTSFGTSTLMTGPASTSRRP